MTNPRTCPKNGFTLPEICVALAVFAVGTAALLYCAACFERLCSMERKRVESVTEAVSRMEKLIESPAPCDVSPSCDVPLPSDVSPSCDVPLPCDVTPPANNVPPPLRRALAGAHLYYAATGDSLARFRRVVRCK